MLLSLLKVEFNISFQKTYGDEKYIKTLSYPNHKETYGNEKYILTNIENAL